VSRKCHFKIIAQLDQASRLTPATITIERLPGASGGLFCVRPYKRRRVYTMPLDAIADWIVRRTLVAEVNEKRQAKKARRRAS
jgi:hypothetical protein